MGGQLAFVQLLERPGAHVPHVYAGRQLHDGRQRPARGPGEDVDLDTARGEPFGHLDDVDVHAAGIAGPRLVERRSMHTDRCDPGDSPGEISGWRETPPSQS